MRTPGLSARRRLFRTAGVLGACALCAVVVRVQGATSMGGDDAFWNLWVVRVDGGEALRITGGNGRFGEFDPAWSPDGHLIALTLWEAGGGRIALVRPDGSDKRTITSGRTDFSPEWSPDGLH